MGDKTKIEWCNATWNAAKGCSRVSEGCLHCYAERDAIRMAGPGKPYEGLVRSTPDGPRWTGAIRLDLDVLDLPLRWQRPRRVFVNSMSDLFHEGLSDADIDKVFDVMEKATQHTFQILTKRAERLRDYTLGRTLRGKPPQPNVWLGVSAENQARANERIPRLLEAQACVRFVSAEPLIGPISMPLAWVRPQRGCDGRHDCGDGRLTHHHDEFCGPRLDWVIVGGESGPGARRMDLDWAREIRDTCILNGVAFFFKQVGGVRKKEAGRELDGRTWDEFPIFPIAGELAEAK